MQTITLPYDAAEDLVDARDQAELLDEAFASRDAKFITVALGAVARARGMSAIAEQTGRNRTSLYKALSEEGDPQLSTLLGVVAALGFNLTLTPVTQVQTHQKESAPEAAVAAEGSMRLPTTDQKSARLPSAVAVPLASSQSG